MPRILLPNLMFEEDLHGSPRVTTATARRLVAELGPVMGLLSAPDDARECVVLVAPEAVPRELPPPLEHVRFETATSVRSANLAGGRLIPWGWSPQAILSGRRLELSFEAPDPEVVRTVNSRRFSAGFDWCFPLPGAATPEPFGVLCSSLEDVSRSLRFFADQGFSKWVVKANLSQAARNRLIGSTSEPDEPQRAWLQRRFDANDVVYAEPWVERLAECGLQFNIKPATGGSANAEFDGAAEMLTDAVGRYRGSILRPSTEGAWWQPAVSHCTSIALQAAALGFFGVMGMDCMLFWNPADGCSWLRVCHDINGRHTMGRLALSLRRYLHPGETGFWCHATAKSGTEALNPFDAVDSENVRIVHTSPSWIGSQPLKLQTALLISEDCGCLTRVARKIVSPDIRGPIRTP